MSSAFVKEGEARHLKNVAPNFGGLLVFLRLENNRTVIRAENYGHSEKQGRDVYKISDGLSCAMNDERRWHIIPD